jgi:hypothetical protein
MKFTNPNARRSRELMRYWALRWRKSGDQFERAMAVGLWQAARDWQGKESK